MSIKLQILLNFRENVSWKSYQTPCKQCPQTASASRDFVFLGCEHLSVGRLPSPSPLGGTASPNENFWCRHRTCRERANGAECVLTLVAWLVECGITSSVHLKSVGRVSHAWWSGTLLSCMRWQAVCLLWDLWRFKKIGSIKNSSQTSKLTL